MKIFGGFNLAVGTAKLLRTSSLLDSYLLSLVKWVSFLLSVFSFAAGVTIFGSMQIATLDPYGKAIVLSFFVIMGSAASITCEALTIGNCKKVLELVKAGEELQKKHDKVKAKSAAVVAKKKKQVEDLTKKKNYHYAAIAVTSMISFAGGLLFWHFLLASTSTLIDWGISSAFSLLVSIALIYSTLGESTTKKIVGSILEEDTLILTAIDSHLRVTIAEIYNAAMTTHITESLDSDTMTDLTLLQFNQLADDTLSGGGGVKTYLLEAARKREALEAESLDQLDDNWVPTPPTPIIPAGSGRVDKQANIDNLMIQLKTIGYQEVKNKLRDGTLQQELGVASSTIYKYLDEIKNHTPTN